MPYEKPAHLQFHPSEIQEHPDDVPVLPDDPTRLAPPAHLFRDGRIARPLPLWGTGAGEPNPAPRGDVPDPPADGRMTQDEKIAAVIGACVLALLALAFWTTAGEASRRDVACRQTLAVARTGADSLLVLRAAPHCAHHLGRDQ